FEGSRCLLLGLQADEQGNRIARQLLGHVLVELFRLESRTWAQCQSKHAGTTVGMWDLHAIHHGFFSVRQPLDNPLNLCGCDILPLPAERIPYPVDEGDVPETLAPHQVTSVEPAITLGQCAAIKLRLCRLLVGVAV